MAPDIAAVFKAYPSTLRTKLLRLRKLILTTAAKTEGVGDVVEALRWGQPAYLTKSGSTIRIDAMKGEPARTAMYFICHTGLIAHFRELYPKLAYSGNRAILFEAKAALPETALRHCIAIALSYHAKKSARKTF